LEEEEEEEYDLSASTCGLDERTMIPGWKLTRLIIVCLFLAVGVLSTQINSPG